MNETKPTTTPNTQATGGDFAYMSAVDIAELVRRRKVSPVEVVRASLERIEALEPTLNAFVTLTPELALADARRCEKMVMSGADLGPLHGVPISVKDLIAVGGVRQTFGSVTMKDFVADADAPAVERIKAAGACIVGKTTTTEFGLKGSSDSPLTGITRNPWDPARTTGGSSAGAGASVAAGATPVALGTDGGGSIRIPSAFCGLFGIKAQFGRVPVYPTSATPTLAHVGPMARTVRDAAVLLRAIAGFDSRDPAGVSEAVPDFVGACAMPAKSMRIAWSPTLGYATPTPDVTRIATEAVEVFENLGCEVTEVGHVIDDPFDLWLAEFYAGVGTRLKDTLATNRGVIDPTLVDMLAGALDQPIDDYYAKVFRRYELRERMRKFLNEYDLLVTPTLPVTAFGIAEPKPPDLPDRNVVNWISYTYPMNLCGVPAASIPCGFTAGGLPVGLQLVSRVNREVDIFRAAARFEEAKPWADRKPPVTAQT